MIRVELRMESVNLALEPFEPLSHAVHLVPVHYSVSSRVQVCGPTTPSWTSPRSPWNQATLNRVTFPKSPSTGISGRLSWVRAMLHNAWTRSTARPWSPLRTHGIAVTSNSHTVGVGGAGGAVAIISASRVVIRTP